MEQALNDLDHAKNLIYSLDTSFIANRLIKTEKWHKNHALKACEQYKNYLFLLRKYGKQYSFKLPPSQEIDEAWHAHILHTEHYTRFTHQVFGQFLHHYPELEPNNATAANRLEAMFDITQELHLKEFGEHIYAVRPVPLSIRAKRLLLKVRALGQGRENKILFS